MTTAQTIIQDALEMLQVYAPGETVSAADAARALAVLNNMLDSWSNESLTCFEVKEQSHALVSGTASYTIGSGGTWNMTRPIRIIEGPGAAYLQDANSNNYQVNVVPRDVWNLIGNRGSTVTSNVPNTLFYDPQYPLGIINIWPYPNTTYTLFWDSYLQLVTLATLATAVSLPPGYEKALGNNLAIELKPYFQDGQLDPLVIEIAAKAKANIKRSNIREVIAVFDPEIVSHAVGTYNPYTDRGGGSI